VLVTGTGRVVMSPAASALVAATVLGAATVGGVFFAFDAFVLRALASLHDRRGADAMRAINITAVRPALMTVLFGTAVLGVGVGALGVRSEQPVQAVLLTGGAAAYLLGCVLTTAVRNVPLNNHLAIAADSASDAATWQRYVVTWARANRVRTVGALGAAAAMLTALTIAD
jgi:uncharacterized membrane protein